MVLPFRSMSEMDEQNRQFFEEFNRVRSPFISPTYLQKQNVNPYVQGILNTPQATGMFTDDAGYQPEYYEEFPERGTFKSGLRSLLDTLQNSKVANFALSAINPVFGAVSGIASFLNRPGFQDFRRSDTLADFFQARRDRKAREEAAARGAAKQAGIVASQQVDTGGGEGSRPGGFGRGAGDFSPSDPTATEGSF